MHFCGLLKHWIKNLKPLGLAGRSSRVVVFMLCLIFIYFFGLIYLLFVIYVIVTHAWDNSPL